MAVAVHTVHSRTWNSSCGCAHRLVLLQLCHRPLPTHKHVKLPCPATVQPLRTTACRWVPDELAPSAFPRLGELRPIPVDAFDQRFDVWEITAPLSEGCGGPELPEEVIL